MFLNECGHDRSLGRHPLRLLLDGRDVYAMQLSLEKVLRAMLVDYSLESNARQIRGWLRRSARQRVH